MCIFLYFITCEPKVCFIMGKWIFMKYLNFLFGDFRKCWSERCGCTLVILVTTNTMNRPVVCDSSESVKIYTHQCTVIYCWRLTRVFAMFHFPHPDVEVSRGPQCEHEGGCGGGRLGDGPRLWGTVENMWTSLQNRLRLVSSLASPSALSCGCFRMTSQSRSSDGGPRPSRARGVRSTSGTEVHTCFFCRWRVV